MKLIAILTVVLGLMSAGPADARHHHHGWHAQHSAVPMPRPRPVIPVRSASTDAPESQGKQGISDVSRDDARQHLTGNQIILHAVAWQPSTSPWRADEAFSRAEWRVSRWP